jgi:hypothetical protein
MFSAADIFQSHSCSVPAASHTIVATAIGERMLRHRSGSLLSITLIGALSAPALAPAVAHAQGAASWAPVEQVLGRVAVSQAGDVMRFNFPRRDLHVTVGDVVVKPSLALGSWVAFKRMPDGTAMAMGDLVLTESEINPVISLLQQGGVEQTAVHNHLIGANPNTMYVHIRAHGKELDVARAIRKALGASKTPLDTAPAASAAAFGLDTTALAKALGYSGKVNGGVYQVGVGRAEQITEDGAAIPGSMGLSTSINFQPTGGGKAAITGDFVMIGSEVNPVIRALRDAGIQVTALHSHMIGETPHLYFMHFWANDDAIKLAHGLSTAISKTNSVKPK